MNYKAIIKKQSTVIAIAVICLTIATIGVSFALFFQVETNSNNQIVTAGTLNVSYGSGSSSISAKELVPMSDDEALTSSNMTGTIYIENKGSLPATYEIALGNDTGAITDAGIAEEDILSHEYIRVAAYLNGEKLTLPTCSDEEGKNREAKLSCLTKSVNNENMYHLFEEVIDVSGTGNNTATIVLKIWIDENAPESIIGKYVYLKMDVTSEVDEPDSIATKGKFTVTFEDSIGKKMVDYRIYGKSVQEEKNTRNLPSEYKEIEYIESTGTQYIDTGVIPNQDTGFDIVYLTKNSTSLGSKEYGSIIGARQATTTKELQLTTYSGSTDVKGTLRFGTRSINAGITANTKMHSTLKNAVYTNNDGVETTLTGIFESPVSLTVFALNQNGTITQHGKVQLYSLKLYDGDTLIRDFVPCYRKSDEVLGLYDLVESKFYVNEGTGDFVKGTTTPTPDAPVAVESVGDYDETTGKYKIPVTISGKNMLNYPEKRTVSDANYNGHLKTIDVDIKAGQTITFSADVDATLAGSDTNAVSLVLTYEDDSTFTYYYWDGACKKISAGKTGRSYTSYVATKDVKKATITMHAFNDDGGTTVFSNFQIVVGNDSVYEPYVEPNNINIYVDQPLRKIGDAADYIDFANQKIVRKVADIKLEGKYGIYNNIIWQYKTPYMITKTGKELVTHFVIGSSTNLAMSSKNATGYYVTVSKVEEQMGLTLDEFNSWIDENNVHYYAPLVTPEDITENIELPDIPTFEGTNILTVGTSIKPSNIEIQYK